MRRVRPILQVATVVLSTLLGAQAFAQSKARILVTGFEPFAGATVNPSWEAVKNLNGKVIGGYEVVAVQIPVDYRKVSTILTDLIAKERPAAYIAFGQGNPGEYSLEQVAHNHVSEYLLDNSGYSFPDPTIRSDGAMIYRSTLPIDRIKSDLEAMPALNANIVTSSDPGGYLCEFVFYLGKYTFDKNNLTGPMGFVHIPFPKGGQTEFSQEQLAAETVIRDVAGLLPAQSADATATTAAPTPPPPAPIAVSLPPPLVAPPPPNSLAGPTLSKGDSGGDVKILQDALRSAGLDPGPSDGVFGKKTVSAVIALQKKNGLPGNGVVEARTWKLLAQPSRAEIASGSNVPPGRPGSTPPPHSAGMIHGVDTTGGNGN